MTLLTKSRIKIGLTFLLGCLTIFNAKANVDVHIKGDKAEAVIELANGVEADFTISFEKSIGLTKDSLGISATLVNLNDLTLLSRLPSSLLTSLPASFPMMITIEPLASKGLSFEGKAEVEIHTHNLEYVPGTPLRLFKAPLNGHFEDITETMGAGSYRARGSVGGFSQFLVLVDLRPVANVIQSKYASLSNYLINQSAEIDSDVYQLLSAQLGIIESKINQNNYNDAAKEVVNFNQLVTQYQGDKIAHVWRSSRDIENTAGKLQRYASTLRFSLRLATH